MSHSVHMRQGPHPSVLAKTIAALGAKGAVSRDICDAMLRLGAVFIGAWAIQFLVLWFHR